MKHDRSERKFSRIGWRSLEVLLFCAALGFAVPPFASTDEIYRPWPAMIIGGLVFSGHMGIKVWRKEDGLISGTVKIAGYLALVLLSYQRLGGP